MSIRFKFRSAAGYDEVDIGGRPSLTVSELWKKVICRKSLKNTCQEFDLVFFDEDSGLEYNDERNEVPSGSTVIIKRVPVGTARYHKAPIDAVRSFRVTGLYPTNSAVDDFCFDRYPTALATTDFNPEDEEDAIAAALRSESSKDQAGGGREVNIAAESRPEEQMKLQKTAAAKETSLPPEFKCFLCKANLRDAVMIPCCQHSFCYKCISQVLLEKGRCPRCSSDKCKVENLLPNLSLRQAVEHFHEYQVLPIASENAFNRYAPDGESGNHAIGASRAVTVIQRKPEQPHSPTGTEKGSNVILPDSVFTSAFRTAGRGILAPNLPKGENTMRQSNNYDEADACSGKREMCVDAGGGDGSFVAHGRQYMGKRVCYMCGSLYHFIRDCPYSSGPHPMPCPGYPSYLNRAGHPPFGSFPSMYQNPPMMPFNASLVPPTAYAPNMYRGLPSGGMMRSGPFLTPEVNRAQYMLADSDLELRYAAEKRRKVSPEYFGREHGKEGWSKHHDKSSKRQQSCSDSSQGRHHQSGKGADVRARVDHHKDSHKKQSTSSDRRRQQKDRDHSLEVRRSRHDMRQKIGRPLDAKGHMVSFSDEERGDDYHSRKQRRVH